MSDFQMTPPLGDERPAMQMTCGFGIPEPSCNKPATWHVIWTAAELDNSICCDEHMAYAQQYVYYDRHPITALCTAPGVVLVWSWADSPGRCAWLFEDGELELAEMAEPPAGVA